jgi:beta-N-acetylhexosaminidase
VRSIRTFCLELRDRDGRTSRTFGLTRRGLVSAIMAGAALAGAVAASGAPAPSVARLAGQSVMTGMDGRSPSSDLLARIRAGQVGGVILFAHNIGSTDEVSQLIARLQATAAAGGNSPLLIAVDQEGGPVRRLPAGPPELSAAAMGDARSAVAARSAGAATAAYLKRVGIDVDLAPVLDTPTSPSSFLGRRAFSRNPHLNAELGTAFLEGLQHGGVAATAKHFPGLGTARRSTDTNHVLLETSKPALDARLLPFNRAIGAGVKLVMVSNAGYTAYDAAGVPALLSRPIVTGLLRERLGFQGVVISDAMEAPGPSGRQAAPVTAVAAGVDVLLYTSERSSGAAYPELVAAAENGTLPIGDLRRSAARIAALKRWLAQS